MAQIVNVRNYNPSTDIAYAKPKINSVGGKNVSIINSKVKKATYLSTPLMLTWGLSEFVDDKTGKRSYDLSLQFPNSEYPDPEGEMFLEKLKEFEAKVKVDAVTNSKEWFNKPKMTAEVVDALFTLAHQLLELRFLIGKTNGKLNFMIWSNVKFGLLNQETYPVQLNLFPN